MKRLKCFIADDEKSAIEILATYIRKRHDLVLAGYTQDPTKVIEMVRMHHIELLFIDLHMPILHGIDIIKQLKGKVDIICFSADRAYGQDLFALEVAFYLNKPLNEDLFYMAIQRVWDRRTVKHNVDIQQRIVPLDLQENLVFQMASGQLLNLKLMDIECIEAQRDNTLLTHTDGQDELSYGLGNFEKMLPVKNFIRVHHSYIVALKNIKSVDMINDRIFLRSSYRKSPIPIGRTYKSKVREALREKEIKNRTNG